MSAINYIATISTMGDEATGEYADRYVAALQSKLSVAFPGADVTVERNDRISSSEVSTSGDIGADEVRAIASRVWDAQEF